MNINKNNYEAFFLDYHEGNLSPLQVADLLLYVEQHPELKEEFESFENVTLDDLSNVSFENKSSLKKGLTPPLTTSSVHRTPSPKEKETTPDLQKWDELLIASIEGTLTTQESIFLNQQLSVDAEMQNNYSLFKQTKLVADTTIVYENKEELKRKERRIVPFFYYVAAAASIALLIGLFFIYNNNTSEQNFADKTNETKTVPVENNNSNVVVKNNQPIESNVITPNQIASVVKNNSIKIVSKDSPKVAPTIVNEQPIINIAENKKENKIEVAPENNSVVKIEEPKINDEQPIAKVENKQPAAINQQPNEFLSLKEVVAQKLKEKTLDEETLAVQKKNGRSKRFTGWDVAQIVTRGISKVTGRDVEVKPTYNDAGDVTAYALGGGFQVTRGK